MTSSPCKRRGLALSEGRLGPTAARSRDGWRLYGIRAGMWRRDGNENFDVARHLEPEPAGLSCARACRQLHFTPTAIMQHADDGTAGPLPGEKVEGTMR